MVPAQWRRSLLLLALLGELQCVEKAAEASTCGLDQQGVTTGFGSSVSLDQFDEALLEFWHKGMDTMAA